LEQIQAFAMTFKPLQMPSFHWEHETLAGSMVLEATLQQVGPALPHYILFSQMLTVPLTPKSQDYPA
jgi:hypothetical protein